MGEIRWLGVSIKIVITAIFIMGNAVNAQNMAQYKIATIAFYNVENLFDTENDPFTFDDDRTPVGKDAWTLEKYEEKLDHISQVLFEIGNDLPLTSPTIIGLCEIENLKVLEDLVDKLRKKGVEYSIIHYDSPDMRGVDVALLYRAEYFKPINSQSRRLMIYETNDPEKRVYTRDQLVVTGELDGEEISLIVNHWPSRSGGEAKSSYKRELAASLNRKIIDSLYYLHPSAKILSMGDFNDDPTSKSIKKGLNTVSEISKMDTDLLFNPMENLSKKGFGTLAYRDSWNLFDQIILSPALVNKNDFEGFQFYRAGIFNKTYLISQSGQYRGYPFRSYGSGSYAGGYSDHFPVYIYLIKKLKI